MHELRFEDDDGVRGADRGRQQSLRVGRSGRHGDLHRGVRVVRLRRVVVELGRSHASAVGHSNHEREAHLAAGPPAVAPHVRDELVEAGIRERVVLHLDHRAPAGHAEADSGSEYPGLGERRVDTAVRPEAVAQPGGRAEHSAEAPDVLAEHEHRLVPGKLDVQRVVDRLDEEEVARGHRCGVHRCTLRSSSRSRASEAEDPHTHGQRRARGHPEARPRPAGFRRAWPRAPRPAPHPPAPRQAGRAGSGSPRTPRCSRAPARPRHARDRCRCSGRRRSHGAPTGRSLPRRSSAPHPRALARPPPAPPRTPRARRARRHGTRASRSRLPCRRAAPRRSVR